jgi:hypothetical protein
MVVLALRIHMALQAVRNLELYMVRAVAVAAQTNLTRKTQQTL